MESWSLTWLIVLIATLAAFVPLTLVVMVTGLLDVRHLFAALRRARDEAPDE